MLKIDNLHKAYGDRLVLKDLTFQIPSGDVYGLLGANGAGKTTTINLICNLLKADGGSILVCDRPVSNQTKKSIGIAPQENLLYKTLTCEENLDFFARVYGLNRRDRLRRIEYCLESVNLLDRAKSPAETLSGGMQRRLNIAIALVHQPKLLILDEPTTGLDIEARYEIWELIRSLKYQGMTVLLTTHFLDEAEQLCQTIGILKYGKLLAEGSIAELSKTIPAREIAIVKTDEEDRAIELGLQWGFTPRHYGKDLAFWLPEHLELSEILARFEGIEIDSISRQPVRLEHIYVELTQEG
jgi:ABC-2 type transport system ATP-binding protein